jgi:hypothetical protein
LSSPKSNSQQPKHNALSDYQRAVLQAMNIPLYTLHDDFQELESAIPESANSSPERVSDATSNEVATQVQIIDESHAFVQQVLNALDVKQIAELGIQWQVHDSDTLILNDDVLMTPKAQKLSSANLKRQLWKALSPRFNAQKWS